MHSAFRKNSLSIAISAVAFSSFGAWLFVPETATIQNFYDRYISHEESRPRVFEQGVVIRLNREAPPVAALEEALRDQPWASIEVTPGFNVRPTPLVPEARDSQRMAIRILSANEQHERVLKSSPTRETVNDVILDRAPALRSAATISRPGVSNTLGQVQASTRLPSLRSLENLVEPSIEAAPKDISIQMPKVISESKTGLSRDQILAALFGPIAKPTPGSVKPQPIGSSPAAKFEGRSVADRGSEGEVASEVSGRSVGFMGRVAPVGRQIMIRGSIELSGGLALTHAKDQIAVLRETRGQFVESGAVWIREARYEIFVESLEGQLVAEVRSPQGEVVGRGHADLASVGKISANGRNIEGLSLKIRPVTAGIAGRATSAYSQSVSQGIKGARVEFLKIPAGVSTGLKTVAGGHFEDSRFVEGSRVISKISAREHWPTVATLTTGQEPSVPLFSNKMMNAFVSLTSESEFAATKAKETTGVIWGRVTRSGQSVAGAEVDVRTPGAGEPIYFNELMLPDRSMKKTGSNGIFAMSNVEPGTHMIQVRLGKRISDPVFLKSDIASVSNLDLDVLKASDFQARAFDAFKPELSIAADIRPLGHVRSRRMKVEGDAGTNLTLANLGTPTILDVDAGSGFLATRVIQNPGSRHLHLPMVSSGWFDRVVARARFNNAPGTGNVIGFIQGARYRIAIPEVKVIYFDERGEVLNQDFGEPGGGFILLGVQEGLQSILVETEGSDRVFASTVLVEEGHVASLSHWLR